MAGAEQSRRTRQARPVDRWTRPHSKSKDVSTSTSRCPRIGGDSPLTTTGSSRKRGRCRRRDPFGGRALAGAGRDQAILSLVRKRTDEPASYWRPPVTERRGARQTGAASCGEADRGGTPVSHPEPRGPAVRAVGSTASSRSAATIRLSPRVPRRQAQSWYERDRAVPNRHRPPR
jgi:hypothetical protein